MMYGRDDLREINKFILEQIKKSVKNTNCIDKWPIFMKDYSDKYSNINAPYFMAQVIMVGRETYDAIVSS